MPQSVAKHRGSSTISALAVMVLLGALVTAVLAALTPGLRKAVGVTVARIGGLAGRDFAGASASQGVFADRRLVPSNESSARDGVADPASPLHLTAGKRSKLLESILGGAKQESEDVLRRLRPNAKHPDRDAAAEGKPGPKDADRDADRRDDENVAPPKVLTDPYLPFNPEVLAEMPTHMLHNLKEKYLGREDRAKKMRDWVKDHPRLTQQQRNELAVEAEQARQEAEEGLKAITSELSKLNRFEGL